MNKLRIIILFCHLSLLSWASGTNTRNEIHTSMDTYTLLISHHHGLSFPRAEQDERIPLQPVEEEEAGDDDDSALEKIHYRKSNLTRLLLQVYVKQNNAYEDFHVEVVTPPPQFL